MFKKIASNTISQIATKFLTAFLAIFFIWILTNYLTLELFWEYNKIYNYLAIFAFLADLWLYTIAIREISRDKKSASKIIWNMMTIRLFAWIFILIIALSLWFIIPWYNDPLVLMWIFIIWIFTIYSLLNSSVMALMQAFMKIEFSMFSTIFWKIVNFLLVIIIIYLLFPKSDNFDYTIPFLFILIASVVSVAINYYLNYFYARKIAKIWFLFEWDYIKYLIKKSLPFWVALFLSVVYFKIDIVLLSIIESSDVSSISIALYSLPMKIVEVLMITGMFYLNSILPIISQYFKENLISKAQVLLLNSFKFLFWLSWIILILWILFREHLILLIATPEYLDKNIHLFTSWDVFLIVLFVLSFYFISSIFNYIFISSNNEKVLLKINIFITIFNIVWNIILIPIYSFIWAWIVTLISQILLLVLGYIYSRPIIKFKLPFMYVLYVVVFSFIVYLWGYYLISNYSIWLFFDIFIYGWILFVIYTWFLYYLNKDLIKNWLKNNL